MSKALTKIYALQQRELNEQERRRQLERAKTHRVIAAFNASGIIAIFNELRAVPLRKEIRQRTYKSTIEEMCYGANTINENQRADMQFMSLHGTGSGPRWWCAESQETGQIQYWHSSGGSGDYGVPFSTPDGKWLDRFIEYCAAAADPEKIAAKMRDALPEQVTQQRRQLQPI